MLRLTPWASLLIVVLVAVLVRRVPPNAHLRGPVVAFGRGFLHGPWMPLLLGAATGAATLWVWGSLTQTAVVHDESAYLLQAQIFAKGRFTVPSPPIASFFQQLYVNNRYGYAAALAFILFTVILALTLLQNYVAGRRVVYE